MGGVKDKYLKYDSTRDHYVVRCDAGLEHQNRLVSPLQFYFSHFGEDVVGRFCLKDGSNRGTQITQA